MTKREALRKLKNYWVENSGSDYLNALHRLRNDIPTYHTSRPGLDAEIRQIEEVHPEFLEWTKSSAAQRKLMRALEDELQQDAD